MFSRQLLPVVQSIYLTAGAIQVGLVGRATGHVHSDGDVESRDVDVQDGALSCPCVVLLQPSLAKVLYGHGAFQTVAPSISGQCYSSSCPASDSQRSYAASQQDEIPL